MSYYKKDYYENACIYMWKNKLNGYIYIGQTVNEKQRYNAHVRSIKSKDKTNNKFHNALKKYGLNNFEYSVLEYISGKTEELIIKLDELEQKYIKDFDSILHGYNLTFGGQNKGIIFSEQIKQKLSTSHLGQQAWNKGLKLSDEHKKHLSESHIGQTAWNKGMKDQYNMNISDESRKKKAENLRKIRKGTKASDQTKQKISEANKKRYIENPDSFKTPEHAKEIISQKNKGKKKSLEARQKMSIAKKGKIPWNKGIKIPNNIKK